MTEEAFLLYGGRKSFGNWFTAITAILFLDIHAVLPYHAEGGKASATCSSTAIVKHRDRKFLSPPERQATLPIKSFATIMRY